MKRWLDYRLNTASHLVARKYKHIGRKILIEQGFILGRQPRRQLVVMETRRHFYIRGNAQVHRCRIILPSAHLESVRRSIRSKGTQTTNHGLVSHMVTSSGVEIVYTRIQSGPTTLWKNRTHAGSLLLAAISNFCHHAWMGGFVVFLSYFQSWRNIVNKISI